MGKFYYIEAVETATELNTSFAGTVCKVTTGKNGFIVAREHIADCGGHGDHLGDYDFKTMYALDYAYTTEKSAKAALTKMIKRDVYYENRNEPKMWNTERKVICVELPIS